MLFLLIFYNLSLLNQFKIIVVRKSCAIKEYCILTLKILEWQATKLHQIKTKSK